MAATVIYQRFERLFSQHIAKAKPDGWQGAGEVLKVELPNGNRVRRIETRAGYRYELLMEGDTIFRVRPDKEPRPGDIRFLESVLAENRA